eukprot:6516779-Pyramimonas_sp.AAC.1
MMVGEGPGGEMTDEKDNEDEQKKKIKKHIGSMLQILHGPSRSSFRLSLASRSWPSALVGCVVGPRSAPSSAGLRLGPCVRPFFLARHHADRRSPTGRLGLCAGPSALRGLTGAAHGPSAPNYA